MSDRPKRLMLQRERFAPERHPWIDNAHAWCIETDDDTGAEVGRWLYGGVAVCRPRTGAAVFVGVRGWAGPSPRLVWALAHPSRWLRAVWRRRFGDGARVLVVDTRPRSEDQKAPQ